VRISSTNCSRRLCTAPASRSVIVTGSPAAPASAARETL
jgi:hypothetical protein